jgi:hypothetical protein
VFFVALGIGGWMYMRRRKAKAAAAAAAAQVTTFPAEEPTLQMSRAPTTHELDSPEAQARSAGAAGANWPIFPRSSPPAYDQEKGRLVVNKPSIPQELPGSTWINEHHPAFSSVGTPTETAPSSPTPMTPTGGEKRSPVMSAATPRSGNHSPQFVSPLGSPRLPQASP